MKFIPKQGQSHPSYSVQLSPQTTCSRSSSKTVELTRAIRSIPKQHGHEYSAGIVATAMVFIWNGFYDIGPANMGYAITSEVPSGRMRVRNNAFVHVWSHLVGFAITQAAPYMYLPDAGNLGLRVGFVWGACSVLFVIWGYFFIPDLKRRNFYEIDQLFENKVSVRKFAQAEFDENDTLILESVFSERRPLNEVSVIP